MAFSHFGTKRTTWQFNYLEESWWVQFRLLWDDYQDIFINIWQSQRKCSEVDASTQRPLVFISNVYFLKPLFPTFISPEAEKGIGYERLSLKENKNSRNAERSKLLKPNFLPVTFLGYNVYKAAIIYAATKCHLKIRLPEFLIFKNTIGPSVHSAIILSLQLSDGHWSRYHGYNIWLHISKIRMNLKLDERWSNVFFFFSKHLRCIKIICLFFCLADLMLIYHKVWELLLQFQSCRAGCLSDQNKDPTAVQNSQVLIKDDLCPLLTKNSAIAQTGNLSQISPLVCLLTFNVNE